MLGARIEVQRLLSSNGIERLLRCRPAVDVDTAECEKADLVADAAGVVQQVPYRDRLLVAREFGEESPHVVVK